MVAHEGLLVVVAYSGTGCFSGLLGDRLLWWLIEGLLGWLIEGLLGWLIEGLLWWLIEGLLWWLTPSAGTTTGGRPEVRLPTRDGRRKDSPKGEGCKDFKVMIVRQLSEPAECRIFFKAFYFYM